MRSSSCAISPSLSTVVRSKKKRDNLAERLNAPNPRGISADPSVLLSEIKVDAPVRHGKLHCERFGP
jgi:hypothetical protein